MLFFVLLVPRQNPASARDRLRVVLAVVLALVGHAVMVAVLLFLSHLQLDTPPLTFARAKVERPVAFRPLTAQQFEKNRGKDAPALASRDRKPKAEKPKEKPRATEQPPGQVVDVAPGNNEVSPDARFAAETNNAVKKETRAKEQTAFYRNAMPKRTSTKPSEADGKDPVEVASQSGNDGIGQDDRPLKEQPQSATLEIPEQKAQSELKLKAPTVGGTGPVVASRDEVEAMQGNSRRLNLAMGAPSQEEGSEGRMGRPGAANLLPSPSVLDSVSGAAANDHLDDVDVGDGTYLNTREWKYASFFNRVKQSVGQQWNPNAQLRLRDPTLQIYGGRDRHTLLQVTLTADGRLKDAWVEKSSGLDFLDLEAVKAFERAQPFPNPPSGLIASDQTVKFSFGFYLEMSGRPGLRLFRGQD